eukprot:8712423-Alexandrium_andersonii.AAC.1
MPAPPPGSAWRVAERWHMLFHGTWEHEEHNNVLEARAAGMVVRRLLRARGNLGSKVLVFTDSMVTLGVLCRGRSSVPVFLHICRQVLAACMAGRLR